MYKRLALILTGALILISLTYWLLMQPMSCDAQFSMKSLTIERVGSGQRTIVGFQPYLEPADYACVERFEHKLSAYLDSARAVGCLPESAIVAFPEYIGTWLVLLGEPAGCFRAQTLNSALTWAVLRQPYRFWTFYQKATKEGWGDPAAVAAFRSKAPQMAEAFHQVFSRLARSYRVFIVAGSIVLPGARIINDTLHIDPAAPLENVSLFYYPDGHADPKIVKKAFPIAQELGFTRPGKVEDLPIYETPLGRIGVLICADSWFPASYKSMGKVDLLIVPSYLMGDSCWTSPWRGYSGWATPDDVSRTQITEGEAWLTYAMGGRLPSHNPNAIGMNIFLKGRFWELGADGRAVFVSDGKVSTSEADIICLKLR
ncbi:MAG: carbon-nitrogen hydrolase family protein [Bacteroidia bacterium]|nr:carbon-nitrogen hydrolase family protein [Bacteroidia bacterium]MCX7651564.1 carbon-nitrogen hydrolase family protein [Bacteroidia bacterium]